MSVLLIDIASYQGKPDFNAVRGAGIDAVFIKATQGSSYVNPYFQVDRDNARNAGLRVAFYHYASATDAINEANYFCNVVGSLQPGEIVALDWEVSAPNPVGWCLAFLRQVEARLGVKPLIYLNKSTVSAFDWSPVVTNNNGLWLANYDFDPNNPAPAVAHWPFVAIEQYSDKGVVAGVSGGVDCDVFFGELATLLKYGYQGAPAPAPIPVPVPVPVPVPPPPPAPAPTPPVVNNGSSLPTLSFGETNNSVADLQRFLNKYNWRPALPLLPVTGYYGPMTASVLHHAGRQLGVQGDVDGKNFGPHFKAAFWRIGFRG